MRTKRFLTLGAMSITALALIAAAACASETQEAQPAASDTSDSAPRISAQSTVETEPEQVASTGMLAPGAIGTDEMIVVLDGESDDDYDGSHDGELIFEDEPRQDPNLITSTTTDLPGDLVSDVNPDGSGLSPEEYENGGGTVLGDRINPDGCENVLAPPTEPFELMTRTATDSAKVDNPAVETMCTAWYASEVNEDSLSLSLIVMKDDESAAAHFGLLQDQFDAGGIKFDSQRSQNQDWLTATVDQGGVGATVVLRIGTDLVSLHNGPTSDQKVWSIDRMLEIAYVTLERLQ